MGRDLIPQTPGKGRQVISPARRGRRIRWAIWWIPSSICARAMNWPRQMCTPRPKARWRLVWTRSGSKVVGSGTASGSWAAMAAGKPAQLAEHGVAVALVERAGLKVEGIEPRHAA